ncbi:hypothetical protein KQX54_004907 [Cotesia glomerata]|uniref:Uncharacterized protein n=1 Tax=Cotesia glomerata TaxID=32391 RepID=A0AAV7I1S6_COTGL|nr:hypothetical protein KQX54_004907 [Cotesia glomerata]
MICRVILKIKERKKRLDINKHNMHAAIDKYLLAMRAAISNHQKGQTQFNIDKRRTSIKLILKNLIYRRTFGLFIPADEKISMDKLIAEDINLRELAHAYEKNIIQGELKTKVLKYDDKSITYYDFIMSCFDDIQIRLIVKNKSLIDAFKNTFPNPNVPSFVMEFRDRRNFPSYSMESFNADYFFLRRQILIRIEKTSRKVEQLEALKKIENLRKAIPLPYELVITIVEYFNYQDFKNFIQAFYL